MQISCENCSKVFKQGEERIEAVRPVSICFNHGINIIMGKSGSGKSTLLNLLAGLEIPTKGQVFWNNVKIYSSKHDISQMRKIHSGFIFQSYNLIPELTVQDNILTPIYLGAPSTRPKIEKIISRLGLESKLDKMPENLSGGEQQRVAIARAIVHNPKVIFADEPTGNLDEYNSRIVMEILYKIIKENNNTLIMVTHDQDLIEFADKLYFMRDGNIEEK